MEIDSQSLTAVRSELYRSLELFLSHVKYTVSLMFTLLTSVFAIFAFAASGSNFDFGLLPTVRLLGATILILLFPLSGLSIVIISRYYRMYCASLFFAAECHVKAGVPLHLYLREVAVPANLESLQSEDGAALRIAVNRRARQWPRSWALYAALVALLGFAGLACGVFVLQAL